MFFTKFLPPEIVILWSLISRFHLIFRPCFFSFCLLFMRLAIDSYSCFWISLTSIFDAMEDLGPKWDPQIWHFGHRIWIVGRHHKIMYSFESGYQLRNLVEHHYPFKPGYVTNYKKSLKSWKMLTHYFDKVVGFFLWRPCKQINVNVVIINYNTFFTHVPSAVPLCRNQCWDSTNKTHEFKQQDLIHLLSWKSLYWMISKVKK